MARAAGPWEGSSLLSLENFLQVHFTLQLLFVFLGQCPWDKNLNGSSLLEVSEMWPSFPLDTIRSRELSFDRGGAERSCLICYSFVRV